ncbi:class F sortase [Arachnia propionica]|uniref:Class F sortase n=1 Tax=Arachnia propionica TaxID=1750 RepID=A0A3P1WVL5_9ACTN|nr:class F sortase [Arachnia propionica]RRD50066.1 class F sortase [Arachnia propionica]
MNLAEALKNRKVQIGVALVAVALAVALALLFIFQNNSSSTSPAPSASASPTASDGASPDSTTPDAPAESSPAATECSPLDELGFIPVRYTIERLGVEADVLSLGLDEDNFIAAPPKNQPQSASWWNGGPAPGSALGQVVMSIHTYQNGGAVGNQLYADGKSALQPGDVLKLWDAAGRMGCYEYVADEKIMVSDFDPDSDVLVRLEGDPSLAIVICWDHNKDTDEWDSRIFFRFKPVTA